MANETGKLLLATQQEKPNHYTYLKEFRVEQCQSFLQHKCNQHRPFICFNWHFQNQRRRRPIRKRDGTFNYSADNYCTKYDETTGICPDGDDCPFLHRTAGDTERRYHLRYYKTCMCVHDTDSRGYCVKNGHHCAFAHGIQDQRPPVYDIKELETLQNAEIALDGTNAQNALDKERNLMNEDPKWQDTNYVLANYKTEPCKRPPRLCRQGYACPQYHNSKDKRRSPRKFKYRSTPCPNVKHGEEWGEPGNCEAGDNCQYCHTRTEQQFHPEIYKSTKCNDVQQAGYCPRSVFCAFAHVEPYTISEEKARELDGMTTNFALSDLISSVLPGDMKTNDLNNCSNSISSNNKSGLMAISDNPQTHQESNKTANGATATFAEIIKSFILAAATTTADIEKLCSTNIEPAAADCWTSNVKDGITTSFLLPSLLDFDAINKASIEEQHLLDYASTSATTIVARNLLTKLSETSLAKSTAFSIKCETPTASSSLSSAKFSTTAATATTTSLDVINEMNKAPGAQLMKKSASRMRKPNDAFQQQYDNLKYIFNCFNNKNNSHTHNDATLERNEVVYCGGNQLAAVWKSNFHASNGNTAKLQIQTAEMVKLLGIDGNDTNNLLVNALEKSANHGNFRNFLDKISCSIDDPRENPLSASLANSSLITRSSAPINIPNSTLNNSINDFNSGGFSVNIPSSSLTYSPTNHTNLFSVSDAFNYSGSNSNKLSNSLTAATQNDSNNLFFPSRIISPGFADGLSISPSVRISELNSIRDDINSSSVGNSLFDNSLTSNKNAFSLQSLQNQNSSDMGRLTELTQIMKLSSRIDETARKLTLVERQRDNAKQEALEWKERYDLAQTQLNLSAELRNLSIQKLKKLQSKLRTDLEDVEKVLYLENAKKCMKCEENNRTVTLEPCNHLILCDTCACLVTECPYCQIRVERTHT